MRLLLVEDDVSLSEGLRFGLTRAGFSLDVAHSCEEAEHHWQVNRYDAVVLDLGLPDRDGTEFLRMIRAQEVAAPVLVLSARGNAEDRAALIDAGADDYLLKPFAVEELFARIRALLRRASAWSPPTLHIANLILDRSRLEARVDEEPVHLTIKEWALLELLAVQCGRLVTRSMLLDHCWDGSYDGVSNLVDVHMSRLRKKLEQAGAQVTVRTVRGAGFILETPGQTAVIEDQDPTSSLRSSRFNILPAGLRGSGPS